MIDWSKQHCGIHQGTFQDVIEHMPDLKELLETFPENPNDFTWDVKVHMLMPGQYPCIPNWHRDMVPRDKDGKEDESNLQLDKPMYLWLSGPPYTVFKGQNGDNLEIPVQTWYKFNQSNWHTGVPAEKFCWRGLIRACHNDLKIGSSNVNNPFGKHSVLRRHTQVYLDAKNYNW